MKSAPYHPSSNGLAEHAIQSFKQAVKQITCDSGRDKFQNFTFTYHPHYWCCSCRTSDGTPSCHILTGHLASRSLKEDFKETWTTENPKDHNSCIPLCNFSVGEQVYTKNFTNQSPVRLTGTIVEVTSPLSYKVSLNGGTVLLVNMWTLFIPCILL